MEGSKKEPEGPVKSKEEILAERKAKKAEKAAKKSQPTKTPAPVPAPVAVTVRSEPIQNAQEPSNFKKIIILIRQQSYNFLI